MLTKIKSITNTEEKKRLISNFFSLSILQIFTYALPLVTLPYLVRTLGVEKYGLVMFAQSFVMFFNILVDYGFNLSATREVSIHREDRKKITEIFSSVMIIKCILIGASFILLTAIVFSFDKFSINWEVYFGAFLVVVGQALFPIWYFQGMEKMKYITIVNITSKLIFTIAIFIFIRNEKDYLLVPVFNGLGIVVGSFYALWIIKKHFFQKFKMQTVQTILSYFKDSTQFFLSRVSVSIYTSANAFVLGVFSSNIMVGYYSIAEKLYLAIQSLYGPINQTLYPFVAKEKNKALFKKIFYRIVLVNLLCTIVLFFFGEYIFSMLFTKKIGTESIKVFNILLMANLVVVPSILLGYPYLGALGFPQYANLSVIAGSLIHFLGLGLLALTNNVTIYNISLMVLVTELLVFGLRIYWVKENKLWKKS